MANYSDLLMSIVFFGDAYVKARKRNEDEKADRAYRQLQEKIQQAQLEAANAKTKAIEREENRLAKEREREQAKQSAGTRILTRGGGAGDVLGATANIGAGRYYTSGEGVGVPLQTGGLGPAYGGVQERLPLFPEKKPEQSPVGQIQLGLQRKPTAASAIERIQKGSRFDINTFQQPSDRESRLSSLEQPRLTPDQYREDFATPREQQRPTAVTTEQPKTLEEIKVRDVQLANIVQDMFPEFLVPGSPESLEIEETVTTINKKRKKRASTEYVQNKVNRMPQDLKSDTLLILRYGPSGSPSMDTPENTLKMAGLLVEEGWVENDETKKSQAIASLTKKLADASKPPKVKTALEKQEDELAKMKEKAKIDDFEREQKYKTEFQALPRDIQEVAKRASGLLLDKPDDFETLTHIAETFTEKGFDIAQPLDSPHNQEIFGQVTLAWQKQKIKEIVPEIKFPNDRVEHLAMTAARQSHIPATKTRTIMHQLENANNLDIKYKDPNRGFLRDAIQSTVFAGLGQKAKNDMIFQDNLMDQLVDAGEVYKEFLRLGGTTGLLDQYVTEWVKQKRLPANWNDIDPRTNDIMNKINVLYWDFRNNLTGAHFSEAEKQDYLSIFPNLRDTPQQFFHGLNSVLNIYEAKKHNLYTSVLGRKTYESVFDAPEPKTGLSRQENIYSMGTYGGKVKFHLDNLPQDMRTKYRDQIKEIMGPGGKGDWKPELSGISTRKVYQNDPENVSRNPRIEDGSFIFSDQGILWADEFNQNLDMVIDPKLDALNKKLMELDKRPYTRDEIQRIRRDIENEKQQQLRTQTDREYMARQGVSALSPERQISPVITPTMPTTFIGKSIPNLQKLGSPSLGEEQSISETELGRLNDQMMKTMGKGLEIKYRDDINFPGETKEYKAVGISRQQAKDGIPRWGFLVIDPDTRQQKFLYFQDKRIVGLNKKKADRLNELLRGAWDYTRRGR